MASPRGQATIADGTGEVQLGSNTSIAAVAPCPTTRVELNATSATRGLRARANFSPTITKSPPWQAPYRATQEISLLTGR